MRRLLTGVLCATLLLAACDDDDGGGDRAAITSVPQQTTTSSTTTTEARVPPPDVIPADESLITEAYVEQVLNALYEVSLEAILITREVGVVNGEVVALAENTNSPSQAASVLNGLIEMAATEFPGLRNEPTPIRAAISQVHQRSRECVFAEVEFDRSGLYEIPSALPADLRGFVRLRVATAAQLASGLNPTAWVIDGLPATDDGSMAVEDCDQA